MDTERQPLDAAFDSVVASSLASAPAWAPALSQVNDLLTTVSLGLGLVLGAGRLWLFLKHRHDR